MMITVFLGGVRMATLLFLSHGGIRDACSIGRWISSDYVKKVKKGYSKNILGTFWLPGASK
jgi:hypothetical protein